MLNLYCSLLTCISTNSLLPLILDSESWYSVTPEIVARHITMRCSAGPRLLSAIRMRKQNKKRKKTRKKCFEEKIFRIEKLAPKILKSQDGDLKSQRDLSKGAEAVEKEMDEDGEEEWEEQQEERGGYNSKNSKVSPGAIDTLLDPPITSALLDGSGSGSSSSSSCCVSLGTTAIGCHINNDTIIGSSTDTVITVTDSTTAGIEEEGGEKEAIITTTAPKAPAKATLQLLLPPGVNYLWDYR